MWLQKLCPRIVVERVEDLDLEALQRRGFKGLIFDLDNTLVSWRRWSLTPEVRDWLARAQSLGWHMCILSNCRIQRRVKRFSRLTGIPALPKAKKPSRASFEQAVKLLGTLAGETVVVGDQLFTDVLGGNRMGLCTVLVRPIERSEFYFTFFQRAAENLLLERLQRTGLLRGASEGELGAALLAANPLLHSEA